MTVDVAQETALSVTNTAGVSGGGELYTANNSASDPTSILPGNQVKISELLDSAGYQYSNITAEGWFTILGSSLATQTVLADKLAPGSLGGTTLQITDSAGRQTRCRAALLVPRHSLTFWHRQAWPKVPVCWPSSMGTAPPSRYRCKSFPFRPACSRRPRAAAELLRPW